MSNLHAILGSAFANMPEMPEMSLRAGNALDDGNRPLAFDPEADQATGVYLEENHWGIAHLDAASWQYYLPILINYAIVNLSNPHSMAVDSFLSSLRPPDRDPQRFGSLSEEQKSAVTGLLDLLAFQEGSAWSESAIVALEERWAPGSTFHTANGI